MINISTLQNPLGNLLRLFLRVIPPETIIPVIQGELKGKKWIKGSGVNSYWLGTYELEKQKLFAKTITNDDVVYDIGANVGFYTLIASFLAKKVYAFEPLPKNIAYLKEHIALNNRRNVEVLPFAVADVNSKVSFLEGSSSLDGKIGDGKMFVDCITLDKLSITPPTIIKIDVEGKELELLEGGKNLLMKYKPKLFLATHNDELKSNCMEFLKKVGYEIKEGGKGELYCY